MDAPDKKKGFLGKLIGKKKDKPEDPLSRSKHGKAGKVGDMLSKSFHGKKKNLKLSELSSGDPLGRSTHGRAKKGSLPKGI